MISIRNYRKPVTTSSKDSRVKVSIIMLTCNALEITKKCIDSIIKNTKIPYEIVFVDNGSKNGSVKYLRGLCPAKTQPVAP